MFEFPQALGIRRIGDVERVITFAAGVEAADEDGLPSKVG